MPMTIEQQNLLRYYSHWDCKGCDGWVIQKYQKGTAFINRNQDDPPRFTRAETAFENWVPISSVPLPFEDRLASLKDQKYRSYDKALLRLINIHTGDIVMAAVL